jgi:hypothetical protein
MNANKKAIEKNESCKSPLSTYEIIKMAIIPKKTTSSF